MDPAGPGGELSSCVCSLFGADLRHRLAHGCYTSFMEMSDGRMNAALALSLLRSNPGNLRVTRFTGIEKNGSLHGFKNAQPREELFYSECC